MHDKRSYMQGRGSVNKREGSGKQMKCSRWAARVVHLFFIESLQRPLICPNQETSASRSKIWRLGRVFGEDEKDLYYFSFILSMESQVRFRLGLKGFVLIYFYYFYYYSQSPASVNNYGASGEFSARIKRIWIILFSLFLLLLQSVSIVSFIHGESGEYKSRIKRIYIILLSILLLS